MKTEANAASAAKVPPAPLLPTYCGHCDLDNEHKSTASLGGWGGALHLLMTQFSFQASVLRLFLSFLFGHLCLDFIIDRDRGSNKKSTNKNDFSAPINLIKCSLPEGLQNSVYQRFSWDTLILQAVHAHVFHYHENI